MREYIIDLTGVVIKKADKLNEDEFYSFLWGFPVREQIVRCRDCKYFDTRKCKSQWPFRLDGFCAWGEWRADA